ncbi:MAG: CHAT domain-containing protein, partial [Planctomycetota bacterium]
YRSALQSFARAGVDRLAAIVEGNLADLMSRQGRLPAAVFHFEQARVALEADKAPGDAARLASEQAEAFAGLGMLDEAVAAYEASLPVLDQHGLVSEAARARAGLGHALMRLGRWSKADAVLGAAAESFQQLDHEAGYARVRTVQSDLAVAQNDHAVATSRLRAALPHVEDRPAEAALVRHRLAMLAIDGGDLASAEDLLDDALTAAVGLHATPLTAELLHARGQLRWAQSRHAEALAEFESAVETVEAVRGALGADRVRAAFLGSRTKVYEDLVRALLDLAEPGHLARAFATIEKAKSRALLDVVCGLLEANEADDDRARSGQPDAVLSELLVHRRHLNALYSRLDDLGDARAPTTLEAWRDEVASCMRQIQVLDARLSARHGVGDLLAEPASLAGIQARLAPRTLLLEYFMLGDELICLAITCDHAALHRHLASREDLAQQIEAVHFEIGRAVTYPADEANQDHLVEDARRELGSLSRLVLGPVGERLVDAERIIVIPHGALHGIPFHALHTGDGYLIDRCELVCSPSASLLVELQHGGHRPVEQSALVVGIPDERAPSIEPEARAVARALGDAPLLLGNEVTRERLTEAATNVGVLHVASHALFVAGSPLASGIRLGDGWLTVCDLAGLRLRNSLVVLSGCDTGRAAVHEGDELIGLLRGLFAAGARSLIMSLWTLNDSSAQETMEMVYQSWGSNHPGTTLAAALRRAQLRLKRSRPHPAFWAPFTLVAGLDDD